MVCCKVHKETRCISSVTETINDQTSTSITTTATTTAAATDTSATTATTSTATTSTIKSSKRLQDFLETNPYLYTQLPVLLARIDRNDPAAATVKPSGMLAKDLEKRERISEVLKEAIETDPKVAELFKILQDENLI